MNDGSFRPCTTEACVFILTYLFISFVTHGFSAEEAAQKHEAPIEEASDADPTTVDTVNTDPFEIAPDESVALDSPAGRLTWNFLRLMQNSTGAVLAFTGKLILSIVIWTILALTIGLAVGIALWVWLRRRGAFAAPWNGYRYVRWLWAVVFFLLPPIGFAYSGQWYGAGRCVKYYVEEERVLDRIAANLICAIALDKAEYELKGNETTEDYARILGDEEKLEEVVEADYEDLVGKLEKHGPANPMKGWLLRLAVNQIIGEAGEWLPGVDIRVLALAVVRNENMDEYLANHGDPPVAVVLFATHMKSLRRETISLVNTAAYSQVLLGTLAGLGIPFFLLACFRLIVWLCVRQKSTADDPRETATDQPARAPEKTEKPEDSAC